jgi:predicted DNA-binding transcriptional regulator AlpA
VDLYTLSDEARQQISAIVESSVTRALAAQSSARPRLPPAGLRGPDAARYIGLGRSSFYTRLKTDPALLAASFKCGNVRIWKRSSLDAWLLAQ